MLKDRGSEREEQNSCEAGGGFFERYCEEKTSEVDSLNGTVGRRPEVNLRDWFFERGVWEKTSGQPQV